MLKPPPKGRFVTRKLADYRLGLYASKAYLEREGRPSLRADLSRHVFVSYIEELAGFAEMIALDQLLPGAAIVFRSEEHTSELQSLMRISYAVLCLKKKKKQS